MKRYSVKMVSLQETKWFGCEAYDVAGSVVLTSGRSKVKMWLGHLARMPEHRLPKITLFNWLPSMRWSQDEVEGCCEEEYEGCGDWGRVVV